MAIPKSVANGLVSGVIGEISHAGPLRAVAAILSSTDEKENVFGRAYTYKDDSVESVQVGGKGAFAGIMINPKAYRVEVNYARNGTQTVYQWVKENYPSLRFVFSPEFVGANGGADVAYMFADTIDDGSTATSATILQVVPVKYQLLGSQNQIKGYLEDATNVTAGVFVTRPWAITRLTGI